MFASYGHVRLYTRVYFYDVCNTVAMPLVSCIFLTITCQFFCDIFLELEKRQISRSYHRGKGGKKGVVHSF